MPTAGHFNHRFVDNYFEAAQGVVVRVSSLKKRRGGGRYLVSNDKKKEKRCFLPLPVFKTESEISPIDMPWCYGWIGHKPGSGFSDQTPATLGVLRIWTSFELSSSWNVLSCYGTNLNQNILDFIYEVASN
jgi:hypothetical protein